MRRLHTHQLASVLTVVALAAAGCGSASSSTNSAVAQGNAPVKLAFTDPGYPAACEKSLETPNTKGHAFNPAQAKTFCGCLQQQAQSAGLSSQSEASISDDQFRSLFATCEAQLRSASSATTTT